jgi:hypothetical protein
MELSEVGDGGAGFEEAGEVRSGVCVMYRYKFRRGS